MMALARVLSSVGLIRTPHRRGFCPACRLFQPGDGSRETAAPALTALALLAVAALAWAVTIVRMRGMGGMAMGLGSFGSFVTSWTVMMAAMMFPTALPLVFDFAQHAGRRRGWPVATALLGATYLGVWLGFGVVCYALYNAAGMPWPHQGLIGGGALILAGLYTWTPLQRASEASCRERCALHGPLPFNLMRGAVVAGVRHGLSCIACSAALMVAMVLIGMTSLAWMIVLAVIVLVSRAAPAPSPRATWSAALFALGALYLVTG